MDDICKFRVHITLHIHHNSLLRFIL